MNVQLTPKAQRSFKKLPHNKGKVLLQEFIDFCKEDNWWQDRKVKQIVSTPFYRYKSGHYRIIFDQDGYVVTVYDVKKRNESTYRNLE